MVVTGERTLIYDVALCLRQEEEAWGEEVIERILTAIPGYAGLAMDDVLPLTKTLICLLLDDTLNDRPSSGDDHRQLWERMGEERAAQGVPLEDLLHAWRIGLDVIRERIHSIAEEIQAPPAALLGMLERCLTWTDAGMLASAAGHRRAEIESARRKMDFHVNFLRRLLSSGLSADDLRLVADYSINRQRSFHAVRARPRSEAEASRLQRLLRPSQGSDQRDGLIAVIDGDICGFVAMLPTNCDMTVGASEQVTLADMPRAFRLATRALDVGIALGREEIVHFEDLGMLPAVQADDEVSAVLADRHIKPLEEMGQSGLAILETLERFIRNGLRYEVTAKEMFVHVNTVRYRVNRFEEVTSQSLRDGDTIATVWWSLAQRRLIPGTSGVPGSQPDVASR